MKLAICMPSVAVNPSRSTACFGALCAQTVLSGLISDFRIKNLQGAYIDLSRETMAHEALTWGADVIFWLDHDHTTPPDAIVRLLKHNVPIVGCGYRNRTAPDFARMPAFKKDQKKRDGLMEAEYMLGGFTMIRKEVYQKLDRPWYRDGWGLDVTRPEAHIGEDIDFSRRAAEAGFEFLIDMALTKEIGHLAEIELKWDLNG